MRKHFTAKIVALAIILVAILSFGTILTFFTNYLWFKEVGYTSVFLTKLITQLKIGIPFFIILTALLYLYLKAVKNSYYEKVETVESPVKENTVFKITMGLSVLVSAIITFGTVTRLWYKIKLFFNSSSFDLKDPIFSNDVGFYIFKMPLINSVHGLLNTLIFTLILLTIVYYFILVSVKRPISMVGKTSQSSEEPTIKMPNRYNLDVKDSLKEVVRIAMKQIIVLGTLFFMVQAAGYFLKQYTLLYSNNGVVYGAGYTDTNVTLIQYKILMGLAFVSAFTFAYGLIKKKYKIALAGPALMIVITLIGTGTGMVVQNLVVSPDEINKESKYLKHNIDFTKEAYGLKDIGINKFPAENNLTAEDIAKNQQTIDNVKINDFGPTKQFYNQRQSIRLYYTFKNVDVDRYLINGNYRQVFLSVREIDESKINEKWINKHLKYTHGYGITLSQVAKTEANGQPDILIENIPPQSSVEEIQITRPEIYFGQMTKNYSIVNTDEKEFDYPKGDKNVEATYEGTAGIKLTPLNKLLFSIRERSLKMLVSTNISSDSKILINKKIEDRISTIAPFIKIDDDPYIAYDQGRLFWMVDAYTESANFPYSEPYSENGKENYIRNSIKVTVDAYNGDVKFYVVDTKDPMAKTIGKIFPDLLKPFSEMPEGLQAHIRYPVDIFNIQAEIYRKYHVNDVTVFYQREDLWDIASEISEEGQTQMVPSYFIMKLPGQEKEEFILSIPYNPKNKQNMAGLLVAKNDGKDYGKLELYKLPKDKTVYGPMQIEAMIDQDTTISKDFALWGQKGSKYIRGDLLVIPIEDSFIYVEPIYLQSSNENSLPEVKRVIAVYGDKIAYENNLQDAIASLFGYADQSAEPASGNELEAQTPDAESTDSTTKELIIEANDLYGKALEAQKSGDWKSYGSYLEQLQKVLETLKENETENKSK